MLSKTAPEEIQSFLTDASYLEGGETDRVVFPESAPDVAEILINATRDRAPVTVSGAGTGTVGGRVPMGGIVVATDRLNEIKSLVRTPEGGSAVAEAGVLLSDLQKFVETEGLLYPPDPTERNCFLGGTVATNASGARTFKYGPTRAYVKRLKFVLATGDIVDLHRGEMHAHPDGEVRMALPSGRVIATRLPSYRMPHTRKHASGYFVAPGMDLLDLFIGSEGTLAVIVEAELRLLPKPESLLSGVVFFRSEADLLAFVSRARSQSLETRRRSGTLPEPQTNIDARALEYFDDESLRFLREKYSAVPEEAVGAIFFEQETTGTTEDFLMEAWMSLLEQHHAMNDRSWFALNEAEQAKLREFRHQLPVLMNEWFARHQQRKISTDMAVPDHEFSGMLRFYQETLRASDLRYTIFGHIGDNHVHVNILPRNDAEAIRAREIYLTFVRRAVAVNGTISAEHGIGKLKREYLRELYGDKHLKEMADLKRAFDPASILGRGNIFSEDLLS